MLPLETSRLSPEMEAAAEAAVDRNNLRILEVVFYIAGAVTALFSCVFIIHFVMFLVLGLNPQFFHSSGSSGQTPPPPFLFLGFAGAIGLVIILGWLFGALQIWAGRCLKHRRHRMAVMIIAGFECFFLPWGTAIGVSTLIYLQRPSIRALFQS